MREIVTIREHGRITTSPTERCTLDQATVPASAFDWLCRLSASFRARGAKLLEIENRRSLCWDNYVGFIETPCGTQIEILPKHTDREGEAVSSRLILRKLIENALDIKPREASMAAIESYDSPLTEWLIGCFLAELDWLIKRGLRFDYRRIESEERYLRGQLNVSAQIRQRPGRQHLFHLRHDLFLPDRPENRLLRLALEHVAQCTRDPNQWRLAHELRSRMTDVPSSYRVKEDLRAWSTDRSMAPYRAIKPWCELILRQQLPIALPGEWKGLSMLFPMEKLFERFATTSLKAHLEPKAKLREQAKSHSLCQHLQRPRFNLQPDILVTSNDKSWVADAKWKLLEESNPTDHYKLSQQDFYQLFAYGQKYLGGRGEMIMLYPRWSRFTQPLPEFGFDADLSLRVLPLDLETGKIIGMEQTSLPLRATENASLATSQLY